MKRMFNLLLVLTLFVSIRGNAQESDFVSDTTIHFFDRALNNPIPYESNLDTVDVLILVSSKQNKYDSLKIIEGKRVYRKWESYYHTLELIPSERILDRDFKSLDDRYHVWNFKPL